MTKLEADTDAQSASRMKSNTGDADETRLQQSGYAQELERTFSLPSMVALMLCLMATWEALSTVVASALISGGAPCMFYNYVLSFLCSLAIAASLGEIASIYPTAGGQYYWVAALSPASGRKFASYFTGWISLGAQIVFAASAAFAAALQTNSLVILNSDTYIEERYQSMLFYWAMLIYAAVLNVFFPKLLPHVNLIAGVIHITAFIAILVVLGVLAPKNTAEFVFVDFVNNSGWENDGVSWLVGLLSSIYPFLGYDAACHLSEEIPHAARNVPLAMVGSVAINGLIGLAYVILLLFSITSLDDLLSTPTGFPFMQIYLNVTNSPAGATVMSLMLIIIAMTATVACLTSTSRTAWAFARDRGLPFDDFFGKVSKTHQVPTHAVILTTIIQMLLGFIYLGNTTAFNAILSTAIMAMYLSYMLPIIYMLVYGRQNLKPQDYGPFKLGKTLGIVMNVIGLAWMTVCIIFSAFPTVMPVIAENMNYAAVVMAGWLVFGAIYYAFWGWKKYNVPVVDSVIESSSVPQSV